MPKTTKPPMVVLHPPFELMQPRPATVLPADGQFEVKLDGFRAVAWGGPRGVELWSRRGNRFTGRFPELTAALAAAVPAGATLDGEICAWAGGKLDFHQLLRSPARRRAAGVALSYVAFDVLSLPGKGDVRSRPLSERRALLEKLLAGAGPQVQPVMATRSREQALAWYEGLVDVGVEGLVGKSLNGRYVAGAPSRSTWVKVRHTATVDAELVGVTGSARRPEAALVRLPDGRQEVTTPRLTPVQAGQLAEAIAGRLRPATKEDQAARVHWLAEPLPLVEVMAGTGRHGQVRFVRARPAE
ncbi:ATP-dependent DNA ligase [Kitasatospora sp. NPDC004289]